MSTVEVDGGLQTLSADKVVGSERGKPLTLVAGRTLAVATTEDLVSGLLEDELIRSQSRVSKTLSADKVFALGPGISTVAKSSMMRSRLRCLYLRINSARSRISAEKSRLLSGQSFGLRLQAGGAVQGA
ncbi:hypothetical protein [Agrobacterium tumefaciens]|uniref:hypothetical protein n=1 Tax=Agrobacterium tumefaciens TaxID=358 RepID=UPI0038517BC4